MKIVPIEYHAATFQFLGITPQISPAREEMFRAREEACGRPFPKAVRDLYVVEDADEWFFEEAGHYLSSLSELGEPFLARAGFVCVDIENQGVAECYVPLNEGDDPPVYVHDDDHDDVYDEHGHLNAGCWSQWRLFSQNYSACTFNTLCGPHWGRCVLLGRGHPVSHIQMDSLLQRFHSGPITDSHFFRNGAIYSNGRRPTHSSRSQRVENCRVSTADLLIGESPFG